MSKKNIAGLTVEIGGDTTSLGKALTDVDKKSAALSRELGEINKLLKLDPNNTELLAQKQKVLAEAIGSTKDRLEILKTAHEQAAEAAKNGNAEAEEKMRALEREIISTEQKLSSYEGAARDTEATMQGLGDQTDATAASEKELGKRSEETDQKLAEQKKAAYEARKELGDLASKGADKAAKALTAFAAAAVATVAAVGKLVLKEGEAASSLSDLSVKTGISTQKLQEYGYVAKMAGTSLDTITGAQSKMIKNMATAQKGTGDAAKAFETLGIAISDNEGNLRDHDEVFSEVLRKLAELPNETEADALAMQIFGKSAMELNPLIKASAENISAWTAEAHELGIVVSDEANGALAEMYQEVKTVGSQFDALKQNVASKFAPIVTKLLQAVQKVIKRVQDELSKPAVQKSIEKLGKTITQLLEKSINKFVTLLPKLVDGASHLLSHLKEIVIVLGSAWGILKTVSVVANAAKAFNALSAAIKTIKNTTDAAKTGIEGAAAAAGTASAATLGWAAAIIAVVGAVALFVKSAADAAREHEAEVLAESTAISDAVKETTESLDTSRKTFDDTVGASEAAATVAERYIGRLEELEKQSELTADEQREYNALVAALHKIMPDLNLECDEQTGLLKSSAVELRNQIKNIKERIQLKAYEELITEQLEAELKLQQELAKAEKNNNRYNGDEAQRFLRIWKELEETHRATNPEDFAFFRNYLAGFDGSIKTINDFEKAQSAAADALADAQTAADECAAETDLLMKQYEETAEATGLLTDETEELTDGVDEASDAVGGNTNSLTAALESARQKAQQLAQSHFEHLDEAAHNIFEKINTESDLSMKEMIENLKNNITAAHEWNENLAKLIEMGAPQELVDELTNMGIAGAGAVKTIVESTPEEIEELFGLYQQASDQVASDAEEMGEAVGKCFAEGVENGAADAPDTAERIGAATTKGFENGLNSKKADLERTAKRLAHCVRDALQEELQIHSPSHLTEDFGENTDEGLIIGMKKKLGAVGQTASSVGETVSDELRASLNPAEAPGASGALRAASAPASLASGELGLMLNKILIAIEEGKILMLDGDTVVGATAERMDAALGGLALAAERGRA